MMNPQELFAGLSEATEAVRNGKPITDPEIEVVWLIDDDEDIADHLGGWRSHVLRGWAPSLMNDRDANISDLADYMGAHPDELILNILPRQIQLRTGAGKSFSGLIGDFTDRLATEETDGA